eukprot:CAMPEP_0170475078 /NCGR_PEP_ID=MMETSP0123-20130129/16805_1 /TAXON_ID=182087 /ORGANISM="Favella ehrenbergii, Strain Fehren 1" /LENGTH=76 /DNA_ID=CAMNT_0010745381 /DNA_START=346 /DNA_END=576 /DNA_ORIENTATION=+
MTIDTTEYSKAVKRAVQDKHNTGMALADMLGKQRMLRTKSMGRAKVETVALDKCVRSNQRAQRKKQAKINVGKMMQ